MTKQTVITSTNGKIEIDLSKYCTQRDKAKELNCTTQNINNLIRVGKYHSVKYPELNGLVLVER